MSPTTRSALQRYRAKFSPMKKRRARSKKKKEKLWPTNARYRFYDPDQLEAQEPRKGGMNLELSGRTIPCAWADTSTAALQGMADLFTKEILRRAIAGEDEAIAMFASKIANLVGWLERLSQRQREKVERMA